MKYLLILWAVPLTLFWSWYGLSANDINFGTMFFSRQVHDAVFQVYAQSIGVEPHLIPGMIAWACIFDTALIGAIAAFRWRKHWWPQARALAAVHLDRFRLWYAGLGTQQSLEAAIVAGSPVTAEPYGPERPAE